MALVEARRNVPTAPAEGWSVINTFQAQPALWLLMLFLLILPAFASNCPSSSPDGPAPMIATWVRMDVSLFDSA